MKKTLALTTALFSMLLLAGCANKPVLTTTAQPPTSTPPAVTSTLQTDSEEQIQRKFSRFIPPHYFVLKYVAGDLNGDNKPDAALVLAHEIEKSEDANLHAEDIPARELHILFQKTDGTYFDVASSTQAVYCSTCGGVFGDPFDNISIERGVLDISHYGGSRQRWGLNNKFRWQNGAFYLIGKTIYSLDDVLLTEEKRDYNLITGDYEHTWTVPDDYTTNLDLSGDDKAQIKEFDRPNEHTKIKRQPLIRLQDFNIDQNAE